MALFFDQEWFDRKLEAQGLTRDDVASALRMLREEVDEIWKDQRELKPGEVSTLAQLVATPVAEVVTRAGIATPAPIYASAPAPAETPRDDGPAVLARLEDMDRRLVRIERAIAELQSMILATRPLG